MFPCSCIFSSLKTRIHSSGVEDLICYVRPIFFFLKEKSADLSYSSDLDQVRKNDLDICLYALKKTGYAFNLKLRCKCDQAGDQTSSLLHYTTVFCNCCGVTICCFMVNVLNKQISSIVIRHM